MSTYYLAIDIGASSGRHILGHLEQGKLVLEEIYRFDNGMIKKDDHLCWDLELLFWEIKNGLKKCKELGKIPTSMAIDTWAVDYVLLDEQDRVLDKTYGYRDSRTEGMDKKVGEIIDLEELYARTGIQKQSFNTIYQLMSVKLSKPEILEQARSFLMIPDYFHFRLTGKKISDYTNATSTQLVDAVSGQWDYDLIEKLRFPSTIFQPLSMPQTEVGSFTKEMEEELGFCAQIILPATHDTASAVLAVPCKEEDFIYISSGTWSLIGIECKEPICTLEARNANFTNEGGFQKKYRFLKNIMGLWMIQAVKKEYKDQYSFARLCELAEESKEFPARVDVNAECFLAPDSMIEAIQEFCRRTKQQVPQKVGEIASVIYQSLADSYQTAVKEIEAITKKEYSCIYIIGGGCNARFLNQLTQMATGKKIYSGPVEATAIGNLVAQMLSKDEFKTVQEARSCIYGSFEIEEFNGNERDK